MGCNQSKATEVATPLTNVTTSVDRNEASTSFKSNRSACPFAQKALQTLPPAALYHHLLSGLNPAFSPGSTVKALTESFWEDARQLCSSYTALASYIDPSTHGTPLHVACSLGSAQVNTCSVSGGAVLCIKTIIDACPEAVSHRDKHCHVPLDGVLSGICAEKGTRIKFNRSISASFLFRIETTKLLLEHAPDSVLLRGNTLYQIVQSLPNDIEAPLGPTVEFIKLLVEKGGASAQAATSITGDVRPVDKNGDSTPPEPVDDDVLALLYRRFVRQFDQSERFFEGDNSRDEVVQHRQNFKNAAVNTFNIIELLLRRPKIENETDLLVHNAVRAGSCPPDLLRYIVETNLEAVAETDSKGNLPLHYAAGYDDVSAFSTAASHKCPVPPKVKAPESYSKYVIDELLYAYPEGAGVTNADGVLPIVLAIESGKKWIGGGIRSLHEAYPLGIEQAHLGEQHPLMNAMSFQTQEDESVDQSTIAELLEGHNDREGTIATAVDGGGGRRRKRRQRRKINEDESHDAIMFVQRPGAAVRDVVTTMWANEEDGGVQMLGCSALELAATASCEEAIASVALLGVTTVVNAMKNHPNEPAVQEKACSALMAMALADGVHEVSFAASGAISTVVSAMQAHVSDATVQKEACKALRGIAQNGGAERATVVASVSGFTALVNSMGAHPNDNVVQREACAALELLTSFKDAYLPELHEQTETLLQSAANKFPEDCLEPADAILSRLK
mmetsp:Transcript_30285/g.64155  ORF Transcript_30285/g.64155 Transcript_30285/m.64155 type:complete len:733 (+) Transcript_30285:147-2345(+)|eukprot:CAMPEP_0172319922 /NCGR_PEP_ID=MMETSP1058-20130122/39044_1 /TAXON_ID=83371 /ORGANISM="Detonula confervacea, Strain CCMP 353" /LENGTH=732 /DNA_ID=CAMNT_0013035067 /DNA_START=152 /DNA_END=2350 /DNA_ORIENTATION=+